MNEALASLSKTEGVLGVVVFDDQGTCIANDLPTPYEPILISDVIRRLSNAFTVFSSIEDGEVTSFSMDCEDGSMLLRRVDHLWLLALAHPKANMNMLNVAMNVVVLNLSRGQPGSGTQRASRSSIESLSGRFSLSQSMSSPAIEVEVPQDAVDRSILQQLVVIYADYMGPAAKAVVKQQLAALGVTSRSLRRGQFGDLVARLTSKIPGAGRQREFAAAVRQFQDRIRL
jgi:predicted regulator of Ras-like GTPase activity (Roadblock/LC7/MglB family)